MQGTDRGTGVVWVPTDSTSTHAAPTLYSQESITFKICIRYKMISNIGYTGTVVRPTLCRSAWIGRQGRPS